MGDSFPGRPVLRDAKFGHICEHVLVRSAQPLLNFRPVIGTLWGLRTRYNGCESYDEVRNSSKKQKRSKAALHRSDEPQRNKKKGQPKIFLELRAQGELIFALETAGTEKEKEARANKILSEETFRSVQSQAYQESVLRLKHRVPAVLLPPGWRDVVSWKLLIGLSLSVGCNTQRNACL